MRGSLPLLPRVSVLALPPKCRRTVLARDQEHSATQQHEPNPKEECGAPAHKRPDHREEQQPWRHRLAGKQQEPERETAVS